MDYAIYLRAIFALAFVLGLLLVLSWVVRRFNLAGALAVPMGARPMRRLAVVETLALDSRRRLVLLRRDGVEHLVIVGQAGETVIETVIIPTVEKSDPSPSWEREGPVPQEREGEGVMPPAGENTLTRRPSGADLSHEGEVNA